MAYNVLSGTISGLTSGSIELTGTFTGNGSGLEGLPVDTVLTPADNRIITFGAAADGSTIRGESNLTFDGSALSITGEVSASLNISASYFYGDGRYLTNVSGGGGGSADAQGPTGSLQFQTGSGGISGSAAVLYDFTNGHLTLQSGLRLKRTAITTHHTAAVNEYYLGVRTAGSPINILFNSGLYADGQTFVVKDELGSASVSAPVTLLASGSQKMDAEQSVAIVSPFGAVNVYTDGTKFYIY